MMIEELKKCKKSDIIWGLLIFAQIVFLMPMILHLTDKKYNYSWQSDKNNYVLSGKENSEIILNDVSIGLPSAAYKIQINYLVDNPAGLNAYVELRSEEQPFIITNSILKTPYLKIKHIIIFYFTIFKYFCQKFHKNLKIRLKK